MLVSPPLMYWPACIWLTTEAAMTTRNPVRTGRQRRDGSRPSGNSRTRKSSRNTARTATSTQNQPTSRAAGSEPGAVTSP